MKLHHIGIITKDIKKNIYLYSKLGFEPCSDIILDTYQNNRVIFIKAKDSITIELIEPIDKNSSVYNFKEGYHHICLQMDNEVDSIDILSKMKIGKVFTKPTVAPALNYQKVVFGCLQNKTFIELIME